MLDESVASVLCAESGSDGTCVASYAAARLAMPSQSLMLRHVHTV